MTDEDFTLIFILVIMFVSIILTAIFMSSSYESSTAYKTGLNLVEICEFMKADSDPQIDPVKLPNGNLGFVISCVK